MVKIANIDTPDDRLLTIQVFYPKGASVKYIAKDMEVKLSGAADSNKENATPYGFVNGKASPDFALEVTQWKATTNTRAIISPARFTECCPK